MKIDSSSVFEGNLAVLCISDYTFNNAVEFKKDYEYRADNSSIEYGLIAVIDQQIPVRVGMNINTFNEHFKIIPPRWMGGD